MTTDPVHAYLDAVQTESQAAERVERLNQTTRDAVNALWNWRIMLFSGTTAEFPVGVVGAGKKVNFMDWPTAETMMQALTDWHSADRAMREAWDAVPDAKRRGLQPPPKHTPR